MVPKPVLQIDTREQKPWNFEGDPDFEAIVYEKLDSGDYAIRGSDLVVIERKATLDEFYGNLAKAEHKKRFLREAERLQKYRYRFIMIEENADAACTPSAYFINRKGINKGSRMMPVSVILQNSIMLMAKYGIHVMFAGNSAQHIAKKILLGLYHADRKGHLDVTNPI